MMKPVARLKLPSAAAATPVSAPHSWPRSRPAARSTTSRTTRLPPPGGARPARRVDPRARELADHASQPRHRREQRPISLCSASARTLPPASVHGERGRERLDVEQSETWGPWFPCSPTRAAAVGPRGCRCAASAEAEQAPIGLVGALRDRDAEPVCSAGATSVRLPCPSGSRTANHGGHVGRSPASTRRSMPRTNASAAAR